MLRSFCVFAKKSNYGEKFFFTERGVDLRLGHRGLLGKGVPDEVRGKM